MGVLSSFPFSLSSWEGEAPSEPESTVFLPRVSPTTVARAFLPGRLYHTHKATTRRTLARHSAIPWADNHSVKASLGIVPELVLGGGRGGLVPWTM